jgi:hypothetical protein
VSKEARRNAVALLIAGLIVLVFAAFAFRPAVVLPVSANTLADSIGAEGFRAKNGCSDVAGAGDFVCTVPKDADESSTRFVVHVRWDGCWRAEQALAQRSPASRSGCVHLWNY